MNDAKTVEQAANEVLEELKHLNYSDASIKHYTKCYAGLLEYTNQNEITFYCEKVGLDYVGFKFQFKLDGFYGIMPKKVRDVVHCLLVLWNYQVYGTVAFVTRGRIKPFECPRQFQKEYDEFLVFCEKKKYTELGMNAILPPVQKFLAFLSDNSVDSIKKIDSSHLTLFVSAYIGHSPRYVGTIISSLRNFLTVLYHEGYLDHELGKKLPRVRIARNAFVPPSWKKENVLKLIAAIDRGNPSGKRNYALLLLVVRLGLRASDVRNLRLSNLDWNRKKIVILQTKTKQTLELPLLDDLGWALIDYLKNGRPKTKAETVFVNHKAPFGSFKATNGMQQILWKYMRQADLEIPKDKACGLHSLRSTLARMMLESNTPLPVISEVLGHESIQTTSIYLKIDLEGLRKCAIDPDEVFTYEN